MKFVSVALCSLVTAALGCTTEASETDSAIGMVRVEATETVFGVNVVGFDATGDQIASLSLKNGPFMMEEFGREVIGRKLTVKVFDRDATHESEGFQALELPTFSQAHEAGLNDFLLDPRVRPLLERQHVMLGKSWVTDAALDPSGPAPARERAHDSCTYATTGACRATSCSQGSFETSDAYDCNEWGWEQAVCCDTIANGGNQQASIRYCGFQERNHLNPCGTEGGNGCKNCWNTTYTSSCTTGVSLQYFSCYEGGMDLENPFLTYN
jgi:hypothetical protein